MIILYIFLLSWFVYWFLTKKNNNEKHYINQSFNELKKREL